MAEVKMPKSALNLPGNSNTKIVDTEVVEERPRAKKVVKGEVIARKRSVGRRLADMFFGEEVGDVKSYVLQDVVVPAIKDLINDVVTGGLEMLLFGKRRERNERRISGEGSYTSYGNYYNDSKNNHTREYTKNRGSYYIQDIIFRSRGEAEEVLGDMIDCIKDYGMVSVSDLYIMVGINPNFIDDTWGWYDLESSSVRKVYKGYLLVLPRIQSLK